MATVRIVLANELSLINFAIRDVKFGSETDNKYEQK
jgi:hypothetical protein